MNDSLDLLDLAARAGARAADYLQSAGRYIGRSAGGSGKGRTALPTYRLTDKGHHDWVTDVDEKAEALIAEVLRAGAPGSRIVGEESSPELQKEGLVWIVDPLDGTTNFLHGYPQYAVSIAAAKDGVLEAGGVLDITRECCYGALRGRGAWCGSARLQGSQIEDPGRALLGTGFPFKHLQLLDPYLEQFRRRPPTPRGGPGG